MRKSRYVIFTGLLCFLIGFGYFLAFPEKFFPNLFPTFVQTLEGNWGLVVPVPDEEVHVYSTRGGFHGDGDAITELHYVETAHIEQIKALSTKWVSGDLLVLTDLPASIQSLVKEIDEEASYFYMQKNGRDTIVFKLKEQIVTVYEWYI